MPAIETRRFARESVYLLSEVSGGSSSTPHPIKLRNLSEAGLMMTCQNAMSVGDTGIFRLGEAGEVAGTVIWAEGGRFGVALDQTIEPQRLHQRLYHPESEAPRYARAATATLASASRNGAVRPV